MQFDEALHYNLEGGGFDFRWGHYYLSFTNFSQPHYDPGVDSVCNRNEYQGTP